VLSTLQSLRDPALGEKQWKTIRELFAKPGQPEPFQDLDDSRYTLEYIIGLNMMEQKDQLQDIAVKAAKEAELLKLVENVEMFWKSSYLNVIPYKETKDVFVLGNNDELISKLDDTLLILNNILGSR
jgi:dynein heavy chain, axonemal